MKALKSARTLAASLGVLAIGALAASPAMAFDNLEWNWQKDIEQKEEIDVKINLDIDITGMVEVEKLQIFLGDAEAESLVHDIYNKPIRPTEEVGGGNPPPPPPKNHYGYDNKGNHGGNNCGPTRRGGHCDDNDGPKDPPKVVVKPLDATTQLPIVLSSASAIGNNQSISSDVPIFLHDGQFVADVKEERRGGGGDNCGPSGRCQDTPVFNPDALASASSGGGFDRNGGHYDPGPQGNLHTLIAGLFGLGAVTGELKHANIEATSKVWEVRNVSVDSSATAVANNISVNLASDVDGSTSTAGSRQSGGNSCGGGGNHRGSGGSNGCGNDDNDIGTISNHVVIADITQFALANVTATSHVKDVQAEGYKNMRELTTSTLSTKEGEPGYTIDVPTPWVSSVATAVGNNVSINVGRDLTPTP
jgi:hypothetical protein